MKAPGKFHRQSRILVIDPDPPDYLRAGRAAWGGLEIVVSGSLLKGAGSLVGRSFDLVVLDLARDDSPMEAIRCVRTITGSVPVVITTAAGSEAFAVQCLRAGARDYFRKPIAPEEFRSRLWDILRAGRGPKENSAPPGEKGIRRAVAFIVRNCDRRIRLAQAAREAGMSVSCFARTFRMEMEETFVSYVNRLRIARAIRFLEESRLSMSEIAFRCGFTNQYHFTRVFKKFAGTPPREFRRRLKEAGREDRLAS